MTIRLSSPTREQAQESINEGDYAKAVRLSASIRCVEYTDDLSYEDEYKLLEQIRAFVMAVSVYCVLYDIDTTNFKVIVNSIKAALAKTQYNITIRETSTEKNPVHDLEKVANFTALVKSLKEMIDTLPKPSADDHEQEELFALLMSAYTNNIAFCYGFGSLPLPSDEDPLILDSFITAKDTVNELVEKQPLLDSNIRVLMASLVNLKRQFRILGEEVQANQCFEPLMQLGVSIKNKTLDDYRMLKDIYWDRSASIPATWNDIVERQLEAINLLLNCPYITQEDLIECFEHLNYVLEECQNNKLKTNSEIKELFIALNALLQKNAVPKILNLELDSVPAHKSLFQIISALHPVKARSKLELSECLIRMMETFKDAWDDEDRLELVQAQDAYAQHHIEAKVGMAFGYLHSSKTDVVSYEYAYQSAIKAYKNCMNLINECVDYTAADKQEAKIKYFEYIADCYYNLVITTTNINALALQNYNTHLTIPAIFTQDLESADYDIFLDWNKLIQEVNQYYKYIAIQANTDQSVKELMYSCYAGLNPTVQMSDLSNDEKTERVFNYFVCLAQSRRALYAKLLMLPGAQDETDISRYAKTLINTCKLNVNLLSTFKKNETAPYSTALMGLAYHKLKKPQKAVFYYESAAELYAQKAIASEQDIEPMFNCYLNAFQISLSSNDVTNAEKVLSRLCGLIKEKNNFSKLGEPLILRLLGQWASHFERNQDLAKAEVICRQIATSLNDDSLPLMTTSDAFKFLINKCQYYIEQTRDNTTEANKYILCKNQLERLYKSISKEQTIAQSENQLTTPMMQLTLRSQQESALSGNTRKRSHRSEKIEEEERSANPGEDAPMPAVSSTSSSEISTSITSGAKKRLTKIADHLNQGSKPASQSSSSIWKPISDLVKPKDPMQLVSDIKNLTKGRKGGD